MKKFSIYEGLRHFCMSCFMSCFCREICRGNVVLVCVIMGIVEVMQSRMKGVATGGAFFVPERRNLR